jgi:MFS family permease
VSQIGDRVGLIALIFVIIHLSSNPALALSLFYISRVIPSFVGGIVVGSLVDALDRRLLMVGADLGRALIVLAVPGLTALSLWSIYPLVIGLYALGLIFYTAAQAAIPDVVRPERMTGANAILQGIETSADLAYAVGGGLVVVLGLTWPFYIDAATFLFSAAMVWQMRLPSPVRIPLPSITGVYAHAREGLSFLIASPFLRWSTLSLIIAPFAGGAMYVLVPLYADHALADSAGLIGPLQNGAFRFSVLEVCLGFGVLAMSTVVVRLAGLFPRGQLVGIGILGQGVVAMTFAFIHNFYLAGIVMFIEGLYNGLFVIVVITLVQQLTPSEIRGRVVGVRNIGVDGATALGSAAGGIVLATVSYSTMWVAIGAIIVLASLAVWARPEVRNQI